MYYKKLCFALIALLVICHDVYGKKTRKNKRPDREEATTTMQPNVVAYSTFGFNDVGSYDGFVPTSPEYSSFLSGGNQESSTRLYAPAFPSAADTTGFSGNFGSTSFDGSPFGVNENGAGQNGMSQYTTNSIHFSDNPNFGGSGEKNQNTASEDANKQRADDSDAPVYGAKIGGRYKNRPNYPINNSEFGAPPSGYPVSSDDNKYINKFEDTEHTQDKPTFGETNLNYQNTNNYEPSHAQQESENFGRPESHNVHSGLDFPRVVDFTKLSTKYYPSELDTSKLALDSMKHSQQQMASIHSQIDNSFTNTLNNNKVADNSPLTFTDQYNTKYNEDTSGKGAFQSNTFFEPDFTNKYVASHHKYDEPSTKKAEQKKKMKLKPWNSGNYSNDAFKNWKDSSPSSSSSANGYEYSTNFSNMSFKYGVSEPKKPYNQNQNHDEIEPASSNIVDLNSYQYRFPEKDYNNFKKIPEFNSEDEYPTASINRDKFKSSDYLNRFKNSFSASPSSSSHWGNIIKSVEYSSYGDHPKKYHHSGNDLNDDIVHIPKRPQKLFTKVTPNKQIDWSSNQYRSQKLNKPFHDWKTDFLDTRYKSEEDLLGLRTHDTSRPSYLPTYKPSNNIVDHNEYNDFKQLVEKWKESYINSKYKDVRDNVGYWPEKPEHVAVPRPHPIEVPHPVIVPVPHPFPVRVPISRPVAVPVLRELTVPIEKPVPYPVYKNVPYPVEKLVPVPVEKEVAVPVDKPYPVHIPHVRPVFHHVKPVYEDSDHFDDEDFHRRPESKRPSPFARKPPYGSRNRIRRPSRTSHQDRNRRRWPERRRPSSYKPDYVKHSGSKGFKVSPYRHHNIDDAEEDEHSRYSSYCRKTGNC